MKNFSAGWGAVPALLLGGSAEGGELDTAGRRSEGRLDWFLVGGEDFAVLLLFGGQKRGGLRGAGKGGRGGAFSRAESRGGPRGRQAPAIPPHARGPRGGVERPPTPIGGGREGGSSLSPRPGGADSSEQAGSVAGAVVFCFFFDGGGGGRAFADFENFQEGHAGRKARKAGASPRGGRGGRDSGGGGLDTLARAPIWGGWALGGNALGPPEPWPRATPLERGAGPLPTEKNSVGQTCFTPGGGGGGGRARGLRGPARGALREGGGGGRELGETARRTFAGTCWAQGGWGLTGQPKEGGAGTAHCRANRGTWGFRSSVVGDGGGRKGGARRGGQGETDRARRPAGGAEALAWSGGGGAPAPGPPRGGAGKPGQRARNTRRGRPIPGEGGWAEANLGGALIFFSGGAGGAPFRGRRMGRAGGPNGGRLSWPGGALKRFILFPQAEHNVKRPSGGERDFALPKEQGHG